MENYFPFVRFLSCVSEDFFPTFFDYFQGYFKAEIMVDFIERRCDAISFLTVFHISYS